MDKKQLFIKKENQVFFSKPFQILEVMFSMDIIQLLNYYFLSLKYGQDI